MTEPTRTLNIVACKVVYTGTNAKGNEYHIHEVMATKPDGSPVELPLRSFDNLPLGTAEYLVEQYVGKNGEVSYTLKTPGRRGGGGGRPAPQQPSLEPRVAALEQAVQNLTAQVLQLQAPGSAAATSRPLSTIPASAPPAF